jgi:hypothetical protein
LYPIAFTVGRLLHPSRRHFRSADEAVDIVAKPSERYDAEKETTMIDLTEEQQCELGKGEPAKLRDPRTKDTYVLVRADVYDRMRAIIDGATKRAGWDDPALDAYEQYRKTP